MASASDTPEASASSELHSMETEVSIENARGIMATRSMHGTVVHGGMKQPVAAGRRVTQDHGKLFKPSPRHHENQSTILQMNAQLLPRELLYRTEASLLLGYFVTPVAFILCGREAFCRVFRCCPSHFCHQMNGGLLVASISTLLYAN